MNLARAKGQQAIALLQELGLDMWLVFVRETPVMADPVLPLVVGRDVTWESFFAFTRSGHAIALVGNLDRELFTRQGSFDEVRTYTEGVGQDLLRLLKEFNPQTIAVNYSTDNPSADGLTHGLYLLLNGYLSDSPYRDRLVSAEHLCGKLRSRKLPEEIARLRQAARLAGEAFELALPSLSTNMTEKQVAAVIDRELRAVRAEPAFPTLVNAGDKTAAGHGHPTEAVLRPGDLLHIDFGARFNDYCSDIQRVVYSLRPGEKEPPHELAEAFSTVSEIISAAARRALPGTPAYEIDSLARTMLADAGYDEYQHALGHQLGRAVHDGGAIIGPRWPRYGAAPSLPLEEGNVFTLELEINLPGIGCVGLEEDVVIGARGSEFLSSRQLELKVK